MQSENATEPREHMHLCCRPDAVADGRERGAVDQALLDDPAVLLEVLDLLRREVDAAAAGELLIEDDRRRAWALGGRAFQVCFACYRGRGGRTAGGEVVQGHAEAARRGWRHRASRARLMGPQ